MLPRGIEVWTREPCDAGVDADLGLPIEGTAAPRLRCAVGTQVRSRRDAGNE